MAMTYLSIIETAKMWGLQVKEYLAYVRREVMTGRSALPLAFARTFWGYTSELAASDVSKSKPFF